MTSSPQANPGGTARSPARTGAVGLERTWPAPDGTLILMCADSGIERRLLQDWVTGQARYADGSAVPGLDVDLETGVLADRLEASDDALLVPVRVLWPSGGQWGRRLPFRLAGLVGPGRGSSRLAVPSSVPRAEVLVGAPARLSQLRARAAASSPVELARFVRRQATLTLERTERDVHGDRYKVPRMVAEDIVSGPRFAALVAQLSADLDRPRTEVAADAESSLAEMVASESPIAVDTWHRLGHFVARAYDVHADTTPLAGLRERNREVALAFLPNHRSYLDPLVLRSVLAQHGWPPNRVLGGNNLSFWPLGTIARRSGIVFIRRSFKDAPIYKAMLREYLTYLLGKRFNVEWYIEGGRTRTGKLRPPRYGLLRYVVDALESGEVRDVVLVPVSIVYDAQTEVGAIAAEEQGAEKQPEGIRWMLNYVRSRARARSVVHIRFGDALSLRDALGAQPAGAAQRTGGMIETFTDVDVAKVAFEVCHRINDATPITPTALVTLALLAAQGRALTLDDAQAVVDPLLGYLSVRGLPTTRSVRQREPGWLEQALGDLTGSGLVSRYTGGTEPVYSIGVDKHLEAAFYRNTLVHFFVTRSIVELALVAAAQSERAHGEGTDLEELTWAEALRLRDLLKFEFFFPSKRDFAEQVRAEARLIAHDWERRERTAEEILRVLGAARPLFAPLVLLPFLEAYSVLADRVSAWPVHEEVRERDLLAECGRVARQRVLQLELRSPEANSRELFRGGLQLAGNRGLLLAATVDATVDATARAPVAATAGANQGGTDVGLQQRRAEFAAELAADVRRCRALADLPSPTP